MNSKTFKLSMLIFIFQMLQKVQNFERTDGTFINKGKVGNWKNHLDEEMIAKFESWEQKWLKDSDLKFVYEL